MLILRDDFYLKQENPFAQEFDRYNKRQTLESHFNHKYHVVNTDSTCSHYAYNQLWQRNAIYHIQENSEKNTLQNCMKRFHCGPFTIPQELIAKAMAKQQPPFEHPGMQYLHPGKRPQDPLSKVSIYRVWQRTKKKNRTKERNYHDACRKWDTDYERYEQGIPPLKAQDKAMMSQYSMLHGDFVMAEQYLKEALSLDHTNSLAYTEKAMLHLYEDDLASAKKHLEHSLSLLPNRVIEDEDVQLIYGLVHGILENLESNRSMHSEAWALANLLMEEYLQHLLNHCTDETIPLPTFFKNPSLPLKTVIDGAKKCANLMDNFRDDSSFNHTRFDKGQFIGHNLIQLLHLNAFNSDTLNYDYSIAYSELLQGISLLALEQTLQNYCSLENSNNLCYGLNQKLVESCLPMLQQALAGFSINNTLYGQLCHAIKNQIAKKWDNYIASTPTRHIHVHQDLDLLLDQTMTPKFDVTNSY